MKKRGFVFLLFCALLCSGAADAALKLATTTSTENSGLLAHILPAFEKRTGIRVDVIAVGTGKALKLAENGDVDVVMVHAPAAEESFVKAGFGVNRRAVMQNDFIIVGPSGDPAGLKKCGDILCAMRTLRDSGKAVFVSRGDDSGTHKKEMFLWERFGGKPEASLYLEIGQGMEEALRVADEKGGYTLSDRGTYLALKNKISLAIVFEGGEELLNPYSVIAVNPARYTDINYMDAMTLIAWLTSPEGQAMIGGFRRHGEVLFHPVAVPATGK